MGRTVQDHLMDTLEELGQDKFKRFKKKLSVFPVKKGYSNIPWDWLEKANIWHVCSRLISHFGENYAVEVTVELLRDIDERDLADRLGKATGTVKTEMVWDHLVITLEELGQNEFKMFKNKLNVYQMKGSYRHITWDWLEKANVRHVCSRLISCYGENYAVQVTVKLLRDIDERDLADRLSKAPKTVKRDMMWDHPVDSLEELGQDEFKSWDHLVVTLEELGQDEFKMFKNKLSVFPVKKGYSNISWGWLEKAEVRDVCRRLISYYGDYYAVEVTVELLRDIDERDLADRLSKAPKTVKREMVWNQHAITLEELGQDEFKSWDHLMDTLEELGQDKFKMFKNKLKKGYSNISWGWLEKAEVRDVCRRLISYYGDYYAVEVTVELLRDIDERDLADRLSKAPKTGSRGKGQKPGPSSGAIRGEGGGEGSIREDSTADQGRKDKCKLCPTEEDPPEEIQPETVWGSDGNQETYRVHLPGAGLFRCSETKLGFEVRAAVTVQYRYDSWDQHLREWSTPEWLVIGPLFNIQAEPATAVAAVHLPHFLCLAGGQADISHMQIVHFTDLGMTLEKPTGVRPFYVVLENPSFSLYGVIFICSRFLPIPVHSLVLIYQALWAAATTLHLYLIPNDRSLEKAIEEHEKRRSFFVDKSPHTNEPLYFGTAYTVCCSSEAEITPNKLTFSYTSRENRQSFVEVYIEEMNKSVQLSMTENASAEPRWRATLRPGDVKHDASAAEPCTVSPEEHFVDRHRVQLIQRTTHVEPILDMLHRTVLGDEQYQIVMSGSTSQEKMRKLYQLMRSWSTECKDQFYEALKTKNRFLIKDLERS